MITGPATLDPRFPGQWFQLETGLAWNWHRTYDQSLGRYLQPDPLGLTDGPSVYGYVHSSPLMGVDPEGRNAVGMVLTGVSADLSTPDPTDASWPKWAGYAGALCVAGVYDYFLSEHGDEHTKNARPSTTGKHEKGQARKKKDRGGEDGDIRRDPPRRPPPNYKGPWPPKIEVFK